MLKFDKLKNYLSIIITVAVVVGVFCLAFLVPEFADVIGDGSGIKSTVAQTALGVILQFIMIATWMPEGKKIGEKNEGYLSNKALYSDGVEKVSTGAMFEPLAKFCEYATAENVKAYIIKRVARLKINYKNYCEIDAYRNSFSDKIKKKIAKIEAKAVKVVEPINPHEITSCTEIKNAFDVKNYEKGKETARIIIRTLVSLCYTIFGVWLSFGMTENTAEAFAKFGYWLTAIGTTIFFSIRTGVTLITETRNDFFLRMIDFFKRFDAWQENN